ncbi:unnamed protein product [Musa acuminata subsp. burmannicoides]
MAVHVKLLAADLLSLAVHHASRPPSFTRKGKPVSRAEAVGVVVSRERKDKYLSFLVDDGSGCIPCILWLNHQSDRQRDLGVAAEMAREEAAAVQLGKLVRVRGRITAYRGVVQITVGDVVVERDPNSEYTTAPTHTKHTGKEEEYDPDLLLQGVCISHSKGCLPDDLSNSLKVKVDRSRLFPNRSRRAFLIFPSSLFPSMNRTETSIPDRSLDVASLSFPPAADAY